MDRIRRRRHRQTILQPQQPMSVWFLKIQRRGAARPVAVGINLLFFQTRNCGSTVRPNSRRIRCFRLPAVVF